MSELEISPQTPLSRLYQRLDQLAHQTTNETSTNPALLQMARLSYALSGFCNPETQRYEPPSRPGAEFNNTVCQQLLSLRAEGELDLPKLRLIIQQLNQAYYHLVSLPTHLQQTGNTLQDQEIMLKEIGLGRHPQLTRQMVEEAQKAVRGAIAETLAYCFFDHLGFSPQRATLEDDLYRQTDLYIQTESQSFVPVQIKSRSDNTDIFPFAVTPPETKNGPIFVNLNMYRLLQDHKLMLALFSPKPPPETAQTQLAAFKNQFLTAVKQNSSDYQLNPAA